jgi:hypothetical protein
MCFLHILDMASLNVSFKNSIVALHVTGDQDHSQLNPLKMEIRKMSMSTIDFGSDMIVLTMC